VAKTAIINLTRGQLVVIISSIIVLWTSSFTVSVHNTPVKLLCDLKTNLSNVYGFNEHRKKTQMRFQWPGTIVNCQTFQKRQKNNQFSLFKRKLLKLRRAVTYALFTSKTLLRPKSPYLLLSSRILSSNLSRWSTAQRKTIVCMKRLLFSRAQWLPNVSRPSTFGMSSLD
jgi:hypothetical protein